MVPSMLTATQADLGFNGSRKFIPDRDATATVERPLNVD